MKLGLRKQGLRRRYGHARSPSDRLFVGAKPRIVSRGATGAVMWDGSSKLRGHRLLWNGPGSSILWVASDGFIPRSPAIDGPFNSLKEAAAAVKGYLA